MKLTAYRSARLCRLTDEEIVHPVGSGLGFTIPEIDKVLLPYCKKTLANARGTIETFLDSNEGHTFCDVEGYAWHMLHRELEQGFQSLELKLNTVPSSRGDFAFTTLTFGQWDYANLPEDDRKILRMICEVILSTRRNGHGPHNKPVIFPKLVYLYDQKQIDGDKESAELFDDVVRTCSECMYPDILSLSSEYGTVSKLFQKTGKITSPMGDISIAHVKLI